MQTRSLDLPRYEGGRGLPQSGFQPHRDSEKRCVSLLQREKFFIGLRLEYFIMDLSSLIEKKITEGKKILSDLSSMRETSGMAINVTYYVAEDVDEAIRKINKWQLTVKDILINGYGTSHRYISTFESTITKKDSGFNFRKEFEYEMNQGLSVLESISESLALGLDGERKSLDAEKTGPKPPLVFISHAELDKEFANEIVTLFEFIGVKGKEKLLCSSVDGYRIPVGRDIVEYLREVFNNHQQTNKVVFRFLLRL